MSIRNAKIKDINKILELLIEVCNVHSSLRSDIFIPNQTKYTYQELLKLITETNNPIFVYTNSADEVIGYIFCIINEVHGNNLVPHKTLYIDDICVDKNFRRNNIASSLIEYVFAFAKTSGCYNVTLNVWANNEEAIKLYEKYGLETQKTVLEKIL